MSTPLLVGTLLAIGALAVVLYPLFFPPGELGQPARNSAPASASAAADDGVEAALRAYRAARPECPACGPRPEADAVYCSNCGRRLASRDGVGA